jgi:hypothetical protein
MIDYYNLADNQYHTQIYIGPIGNSSALNIFYWVKPRGITMIHITAIGAGGGGGSGVGSTTLTAGSGGSGGGSGALTRLTIPAIFIPDQLKITVAAGGTGGVTGSGGATAGNTFVDSARGADATSTRLIQVNGGAGGSVGSAAGSVAGGGAGAIGTQGNAVYQSLGTWLSIAGQAGAASGVTGATGVSIVIVDSGKPVSGGASGGGKTAANVNNVGGDITGIPGAIPTVTGGAALSDGTSGYFSQVPFFSLGGAGGGANAGGTGGRGGNGGPGSGGGGGGAGLTSGTGNGPGGNGGPGMVIITCW